MEPLPKQLNEARAAKSRALEGYSRFGTVSGVGLIKSAGSFALKVNFSALTTAQEAVPREWEGLPVEVELTGPIVKRGIPQEHSG